MDLTRVPVSSLVRGCRGETDRFLRREAYTEAYCFELFRRAICSGDGDAWQAIVTQYRGSVLAWVRRQSIASAIRADDDEWVDDAFTRFWKGFTPDRLAASSGLAAVLKYLQVCAYSSVLDRWRRDQRVLLSEVTGDPASDEDEAPRTAALAESRLIAKDLWQAIRQELPDEHERRTIYLSFVLGLKPGQIQERYPEQYRAIDDVYRIKRNALDRLRRSERIQEFLE